MRVALLSCGESLRRFPGVAGYDLTIGVNDAATFALCDFWSIGDAETHWRIPQVLGSPTIWTHEDTARRLGYPPRVKTYERSERIGWTIFSVTAGLWLAGSLGARVVECFGLYDPNEGCLFGTNPHARRTPDRWETERRVWEETAEAMRLNGVEVIQ